MRQVPLPVTGIRLSLWRAVAYFRLSGLVVCLFLIVKWQSIYERPALALAVGAGMAVVTGALALLAARGRAHRWQWVGLDLIVTSGLTLATIAAQTDGQRHGGMVTLTTIWAAGPTIEAALVAGPLAGLAAGAFQLGVAMATRGGYSGETLYSGIVLIIVGLVVGLVATYAVRAEDELRVAAAARAALAERERLARTIHDGVLQVLGLVHRTGRDSGDREWARLAQEAGAQEAALRGLITSRPAPSDDLAVRDLAEDLRALRSSTVTVSAPAGSVALPGPVAREVGDAVRAALHNVAQHAGDDAQAWVLVETVDGEVHVTVRDDGVGFAPARLVQAVGDGRLGVDRSIRGRIEQLGGRCTITSAPGQGTEIEMAVPSA